MKKLLLLGFLAGAMHSGHTAEPMPAFMQPEVMQAAMSMQLTEAQRSQFQQVLASFYNERVGAINKLLRRNNQTNIERKIQSKTNSLLKKMDEEMAAFLTPEQMPAYDNYRTVFKSNLIGM